MENKRILCICNTPLQLLNMINVISSDYQNEKRDLLITDEIRNCEILIENIRKSNFFENVYLVNEDYKTTVFLQKNLLCKIYELNKYRKRLKAQYDTKKIYDRIFFGGKNWLNNFVAKQIRKNKKCEFAWIDEGTASYSTHGLFWKKNWFQKVLFRLNPNQLLKELFGINYLINKVNFQYLYRPEIADYEVPFPRKQISLLNSNSDNALLFKQIFGCTENNFIKEKYIYFDGAGDADGLYGNDKELLALVAECVGKENLLVKVHPRSSIEYYIQNGYHINTNLSIPWEIYCLEPEQLNNKVLISIFSTAIVSPYIYFGLKNKVISLIHLYDKSFYNDYYKYLLDFIERKIFLAHKDIYMLPNTFEELKKYLT
ncbi:hypothetical protein Trebr_1640 [Treponema brennaborense DSM 12168]|uniref:Uncharacterized protein n=2 Tax=Treponema TaxID=157 RepID=F4LPR7_TREBD|nr:hypothetical protein Trebr_1640 [Treponema brennaborense DSM 12168]